VSRHAAATAWSVLVLGVLATAVLPAGVGGAATDQAVAAITTGSLEIVDDLVAEVTR
jgi:uncharacterized protein YejL (UPF0352 family)